jgi:hypothetical protein
MFSCIVLADKISPFVDGLRPGAFGGFRVKLKTLCIPRWDIGHQTKNEGWNRSNGYIKDNTFILEKPMRSNLSIQVE